uniref:Uncharacterized protein n=1 Tax=Anguilla anguilla TaxID=7936 RepID=A0A0E9U977_ANGAN
MLLLGNCASSRRKGMRITIQR